MKKKIVALSLCVAMLAIAIVGGTMAYFTDADKDVNVMTSGKVEIVQNETDRNGKAYTDGQVLMPAVYLKEGKAYNPTTQAEGPVEGTQEFTGPDGKSMKLYADSINNEIDKVISVTNTGNYDAYVRTFVLIEGNDSLGKNLHIAYNDKYIILFIFFCDLFLECVLVYFYL